MCLSSFSICGLFWNKYSSFNSHKERTPKLRFGNFSDEWTKCKIEDIACVVGGGTPDTAKENYWGGDIQWFTPTEVGYSKYVTKSVRTITEEGLRQSSAKMLAAGSVLLSSRATIGECSIALQQCTTNQGFQSLIPKDISTNEFLYYLALSLKTYFLKHASGSTFLEISNFEIRNTPCVVPCQNEQQKIAGFLSLIDKRIDKQFRLISLLKSYKRGLLISVFSKPNNRWEKHKLSDFAKAYGGYAFDSKSYTLNGNYRVLTIGNVTGARYVDISESKRIVQIPNDLQLYQKLNMGDLVISMTGNVGRISIVNDTNCLLNQRVAKLVFTDLFYREIIFQILSCDDFAFAMEQKGQGAAQKNIKNSDIENYEFCLPSTSTQINILSNIFRSLDTIIDKESKKYAYLIQVKSTLLQQLFI